MPSPVGHALGGIAAAFVVDSLARRPVMTLPLLAASAVIAVTPDLDILTGSHRTYSHSIGAVAMIGVIAWMILRARGSNGAVASALAAAYASHLPLDWLSKDTSHPSGLMALWPFTVRYYTSGWNVFGEISRRYWLPDEFILGNLRAAAWEFAIVGPFALLAWIAWSARTLTRENGKQKTKTE